MPQSYELLQNYPNPFNPTTTIKYEIPKMADVRTGVDRDITRVDIARTSVDPKISPSNSLQSGRHMSLHQSHVKLTVYDILGNEITTLVNKYQRPGKYEVTFNAGGLSSGVYFYKLTAGEFIETKKMILLR